MAKVFVINRSAKDFSKAEKYGELIFLTEGHRKVFNVANDYRELIEKLKDATPDDYILLTGLRSTNAVAAWILGRLGLPLRLLIFDRRGWYVPRTLNDFFVPESKEETNENTST